MQQTKVTLENHIAVLRKGKDGVSLSGRTLASKNILLYTDESYSNMLSDCFCEVADAMQTELDQINAKLNAIEELLK